MQAVEDDAAKEDDDEEDLDGADDIVCMGQPTVKDLENLAELSKLTRRLLRRLLLGLLLLFPPVASYDN